MSERYRMGIDLALDTLQKFVADSHCTTNYTELRRAVHTLISDYTYWKDMFCEYQPVTPSDPVNGMSTFDREFTMQPDTRSKKTKIKDLAVAVAVLQDRVTKLEK